MQRIVNLYTWIVGEVDVHRWIDVQVAAAGVRSIHGRFMTNLTNQHSWIDRTTFIKMQQLESNYPRHRPVHRFVHRHRWIDRQVIVFVCMFSNLSTTKEESIHDQTRPWIDAQKLHKDVAD